MSNRGLLGFDLLLARAGFHQLVLLSQRLGRRAAGANQRGRVIELLGSNILGQLQPLESLKVRLGVGQIRLRLLDPRQRGGDFLRPRTGLQFGQISFRIIQQSLLLRDTSPKFIILEPHQHLTLFDLVAHLDAHPRHPTDHLAGQLDLVGGHDVSGGIKDHPV